MTISRYFIQLSYDGTNFCGWQHQKNGVSIQESIENALTIIYKSPQKIVGCGRTDTGVHADRYYAHWDLNLSFDPKTVLKANAILPNSIAIEQIFLVDNAINARFDATSRTYKYYIHLSKNPFLRQYSYEFSFYTLDYELMVLASNIIKNQTHFLPLIKLNKDNPKTNCTIHQCEWSIEDNNKYVLTIRANRFLHNMVRRIVGACILVGRNKLSLSDLENSLITQTSLPISLLVPPNGLHLVAIEYPFLSS